MAAQTDSLVAMKGLGAGMSYFGLVFAAGFLFGSIRQLWLVPRLGTMLAELIEAPFMLTVIVLAARWIIVRFELQRHLGPRLFAGGLALALLLVAELTLVLGLRGLTLGEYLATREPISGTVYLIMLGFYAIMPSLLAWDASSS